MRVHYVLLLAAGALFASVEADAVATDSAPGASTADRLAIAEKNAVSVSRSLRMNLLTKELDGPLIKLVLNGSTEVLEPLKGGPNFRKWLQHMKDTSKMSPADAAHASLQRSGRPIEELYNALKQTETDILAREIKSDDDVLNIAKKVRQILVEQLVRKDFYTLDLKNGLSALQRHNPYWLSESDAIYSVLKERLSFDDVTTLIVRELKKADTKELAEKLQRSQFDHWGKVLGADLEGALRMHGHHNGVGLVKAEQIFLLKYVEHLIEMRVQNRLSAKLTKSGLKYPTVFTELIAAVKKEELIETGEEQLIKRWVDKKLHPDGVSWVLGEKALEEGTREHKFMTAYKRAYYEMEDNMIISAKDYRPWIAALKQKKTPLTPTTPQ